MRKCMLLGSNNNLRRKISVLLIVSFLFTNLTNFNLFANELQYHSVPELEVEMEYIEDSMFYMPYNSFEVNEADNEQKYVFKVLRYGNAEKSEKVKLTMVDISAKYNRDYSIKVIDQFSYSEKIQNANVSKSVDEFVRNSDYEEYNYSDAIVDGSIKPDDVMSEEEQENYEMSDEEKQKLLDDAKNIFDEYDIDAEIEGISKNDVESIDEKETSDEQIETTTRPDKEEVDENETNNKQKEEKEVVRGQEEVKEQENEETTTMEESINAKDEQVSEDETEKQISGFTDTETSIDKKEESTKEIETTTKETNEETTNDETEIEKEEINTNEESKEQTKEESKEQIKEETKTETNRENIDNVDNVDNEPDNSLEEKTISISTDSIIKKENNFYAASLSEVAYSDDKVEFKTITSTKSNISLREAYEAITGKKSDKKHIIPNGSVNSFIPNKNSKDDLAYMQNNIDTVSEELKSAYVILNFKSGQNEKIIEITIKNDNKYRGTRQTGFNLSSVDGSLVSGLYSSLTLQIHDDEEVEPTYINFTNTNWTPKDGYMTVTVERSGDLSSIATCMIDTEDITAKSGRDYSKVHAQLVFGLGIDVRTVKIPIVSKYITNTSEFKLKLQEAKGALIGDNGTSTCIIKKSDKSFEVPNDDTEINQTNKNKNSTELYGSNNSELDNGTIKPTTRKSDSNLYGAGGKDYDLDSVFLGDPLPLDKCLKNFKSKKANKNSNHYYIENNKGYHMYLENKDAVPPLENAYYEFDIDTADIGYRYDWAGVQFDWYSKKDCADIEIKEWIDSTKDWNQLYRKNDKKFSRTTDDFILENEKSTKIHFWLRRENGFYGSSPTVEIYSIRPILKMYRINLIGSEVPKLINDDGVLTSANKYAKYALTSIEGSKSDHTAVGWTGKTITVKLDNTVNNPFYIKRLWIRTASTGGMWDLLTQNFDTESTSISFKMDDNFAIKYKDFINAISRPNGGKNGEFNLYAELDVKSSVVKVEKDERVNVKIWDRSIPNETTDETDNWSYHVGDTLHFSAEVKPEYQEIFECNGLNIYRIKPYSPDWITIRKPLTGENYFPLDLEYSEIKVVPVLSKADNLLIVRVPKDKQELFDLNYGIFTTAKYETDDYYEYYVETDSSKISGNYFELKAKCVDDTNVPVWYENNKNNIKYTQNTYYFLASTEADDNIVYLTCEAADDRKYSIEGTAYYEEAAIGGKTTDRYWQAAPNIGILIDDYHFGYTDDKGEFSIIPGQGKEGYYKKLKIVSNSYDRYINVALNKNNPKTNTYTLNYDDGEHSMTEDVYSVNAGEVLISNVTKDRPSITGVKSKSMNNSVYGAVYINDAITVLEASVNPVKADGSNFTYKYKQEDGSEIEAVESVKRVEFVVVDKQNYSIKKVISATKSNADKTVWTAYYTFERDKYSEYMSGDKLYARIVTDRRIGDGKADDISDPGTRVEIPTFMETTYQSIPTTLPFIEEAIKEPFIVHIDFPESIPLEMPVLGHLQSMFNMMGMSFGITTDGDRIRLHLGKVFKQKGNHFDENGKKIADNGNTDVTASNLKNEMKDMADMINNFGTKRLGAMTLGIKAWTFEPIVGLYFEFMVTYNPTSVVETQYEFTGAGGYFGGILDFKYTYYILIYGIPFYVGGSIYLTLATELGIAVDAGQRIPLNDPDQGFFDSLLGSCHLDFIIKAIVNASAYVGVGICGTLGARGGFQLEFLFLWNPAAKLKYPGIRPAGFAITGGIKFWIDAALLTIPIPVYTWRNFFTVGYFEDLDKITSNNKSIYGNNLYGSDSVSDMESEFGEIMVKPRPEIKSEFVANDNNDKGLFGGTYEEDKNITLVENAYDSAEPKLANFPDPVTHREDKSILVYLDDDPDKGDLDRTTLMYTVYDWSTGKWSDARKVWADSETADFSPTICEFGNTVMLAWVKRPEKVDENTPTEDLLKKMEIYTSVYNSSEDKFETPMRMTNDDIYDYYPQLVYNQQTFELHLYYLKSEDVVKAEKPVEFINNIRPEVNRSYLMYMLYADPNDGGGKRWLTDVYFDSELPKNLVTEEEKQAYITAMQGQRIQDLSIDIGGTTKINDPNISDYTTESIRTMVFANQAEINYWNQKLKAWQDGEIGLEEAWMLMMHYTKDLNVIAYVVDEDGNVETKDDTEIYLRLNVASSSEAYTVRLTNNNTPDLLPKFLDDDSLDDNISLFWIQNESTIKMVDVNTIIEKAIVEDHANTQIEVGDINVVTVDKVIMSDKISNYVPFSNEGNTYLVWQQDSNTNFSEMTYDGEVEFKQDLYVAGLVKTEVGEGENKETVQTWTNPVRFTDNGKVNDLPAVAVNSDELMFVDNQYNLKSNDKVYDITNCNLQAIIYKPKSSLYIKSVENIVDDVKEDGSIQYKTMIGIQNTGLSAAKGFDYTGQITYDGTEIADFSGNSNEVILPGSEARIGGLSYGDSSIETPAIYFPLTKDQQKHLDKVKIEINIKEHQIYHDIGVSSTKEVFDVKEYFAFTNLEGNIEEDYGNVIVEQSGDTFILKGLIKNTGSADSTGNEKIYVIDQWNFDKPIATSDYIDMPIGSQMQFEIPVDCSKIVNLEKGVKDLVVYVTNDEGKQLSDYEVTTINAKQPFNFKVNGGADLIQIKKGESIDLTTTYSPNKKYKSATILYTVSDGDVAKTNGNKLLGINEGKTKLTLTTKEFGGTKEIDILVNPAPAPAPTEPTRIIDGGGSDGSGAGSSINKLLDAPKVTELQITKTQTPVISNNQATWIYDPILNTFKLLIDINGTKVQANNIFVPINEIKPILVDGKQITTVVQNTYCFDATGNMLTGWVKTADNKWYFFENEKTMNEGKMVVGWKFIQNAWYYFTEDGSMLVSAITLDGYYVGADGKYIAIN